MAPVVEVITERLELGEGPHWDVEKQCLYFVDIFGPAIYKYVPATGKTTKAVIGKYKIPAVSFNKFLFIIYFLYCFSSTFILFVNAIRNNFENFL